jgi:DNA-binding NarL/FixJ family response regulator
MPTSSDTGVLSETVRVVVVDDHRVFTDLLSYALSTQPWLTCVGTASTGAAGVAMVADLRPDVVVMDIEMPRQDGLAATRRIREIAPEVVIVIVSAHRDPEWVGKAGRAGASAFVAKNGPFEELLDVLHRVRHGSMLVAPSTYHGATADSSASMIVPVLTQREHDVLAGLNRGLTPTAIAMELGIRVETCRGYVKTLHSKLGVHSQLEALVRAQRLGLVDAADE